VAPDGTAISPERNHRVVLARLDGEFAEVPNADGVLAALD